MRGIYTLMLCATLTTVVSQNDLITPSEQSDPEATAVLTKMEAFLDAHHVVEVDFQLTMSFPGEEPIEYSGKLEQQGEMYRVDLGAYQILSDGYTRWVYLPEANEVNVYNVSESEAPQTPVDFLKVYQSEEFLYALMGTSVVKGKEVHLIEFKPLDKYSDFSKLRLSVRMADYAPARIEIFEKGGARNDMLINAIRKMSKKPDAHFVFRMSDYPNIRVEDLRID